MSSIYHYKEPTQCKGDWEHRESASLTVLPGWEQSRVVSRVNEVKFINTNEIFKIVAYDLLHPVMSDKSSSNNYYDSSTTYSTDCKHNTKSMIAVT